MIEEVMLVLQQLLDADELDAVRQVDVHGHDVYVKLDEPRQPCRQCKRTAEEIQRAIEKVPGVAHAHVELRG